ncbi:hypothetical protein M8J77_011257 [Diaphorina citri]|nr:hypothetical protein M8J77_011257 [Diaphorina citri]
MPMGEFTLRPNQDGINKTLQGPVRMPRRNSSKFTLSRNQGNIEKTSIAKPVRNSCKFTLSRNQGGIDKTVQADRMHNRGNMLEVVKHDNRNNALEVVKQDNRSNVLAVVKHEERIENMARRRNFLGNKKKAEIDRIQFLKQQEPDCMPDPPEPDTPSEIKEFQSVNFIQVNKLKLMLLQHKKDLINKQISSRNSFVDNFKLKQFINVPSKHMEYYKNRNSSLKMKTNTLTKASVQKSRKKVKTLKSNLQNAYNFSNLLVKNAIIVPSRYMNFYDKYNGKVVASKKVVDKTKKTTSQRNRFSLVRPMGNKTASMKGKQLITVNYALNSLNTGVFTKNTTNTPKTPNKKMKPNKNKRKTLNKQKKAVGMKSRYLDCMDKYKKNNKLKRREQKQVNDTTNQPLKHKYSFKTYRTNMTKAIKNAEENVKLDKKKLKRELRKKYCCGAYGYMREDLERKYNERFVKWYQSRHPKLFPRVQAQERIPINTPNKNISRPVPQYTHKTPNRNIIRQMPRYNVCEQSRAQNEVPKRLQQVHTNFVNQKAHENEMKKKVNHTNFVNQKVNNENEPIKKKIKSNRKFALISRNGKNVTRNMSKTKSWKKSKRVKHGKPEGKTDIQEQNLENSVPKDTEKGIDQEASRNIQTNIFEFQRPLQYGYEPNPRDNWNCFS